MPFFKLDNRLVYYAHVPKCGGSSVANYLRDRFGDLAFYENWYKSTPEHQRWTKSSPQHVDVVALERLIPLSFFSDIFTIVRHPVGRAISTYHFQLEVERSVPEGTSFTDWLSGLGETLRDSPFAYDNHTRPMSDIVPAGAQVFYMEHGLDALVPWFDALTGRKDAPRALLPENTRGAHVKPSGGRVTPSSRDLDLIAEIYSADFERFGYVVSEKMPQATAPVLDADFQADRDRALAQAMTPVAQLRRRIQRRFRRHRWWRV